MSDLEFHREVLFPVPVPEAFAWHGRPGALDRLLPPWEKLKILERSDGIHNGQRVVLKKKVLVFPLRWVAEHCDYQPNRQFRDIQVRGPFTRWDHLHSFKAPTSATTLLSDRVQYRLPGGVVGRVLAKRFVHRQIDRMFTFRHSVTLDDLQAHARFSDHGSAKVAVTGSHGLIGSNLVPFLTTGGHQVFRMVRGTASAGQLTWNPGTGHFDPEAMDSMDAVIHLAGENIASRRWSRQQKERIRQSRVDGTRLLCEGLARLRHPPQTLITASAVGFYGDRGSDLLDETSSPGSGFLSEVAQAWEAATKPAVEAGIRVVHVRFGMVLTPQGGALQQMLLPFQLGGGGVLGDGQHYWSWVSLDDAIGALHHSLMTRSLSGPVNVVTPNPVTNRQFTKTLGSVLKRPTIVPIPRRLIRAILGEMGQELLLASTRVQPHQLVNTDYRFRHPTLDEALRHILGRT